MSKGSKQRPSSVPEDVFTDNWRRTFGERVKTEPMPPKPKETDDEQA